MCGHRYCKYKAERNIQPISWKIIEFKELNCHAMETLNTKVLESLIQQNISLT